MIIFDPSAKANSTRGTVCDELVESIDLAATFYEAAGGDLIGDADHIIEGHSLLPLLYGTSREPIREYAFSEYDYSATPQAMKLGMTPRDARLFMVFDGRFKMIHAEGGLRPMLFDLDADPRGVSRSGQGRCASGRD